KGEAMVMGDLTLMQDEVNPVMSAALDHGLQVTALHNHFFFDEPKVYFMHIGGEGDTETLTKGVRAALDTIKRIRANHPQPSKSFGGSPPPAKSSITPEPLERILGAKGETKDGMSKAVFGRSVKMPCGCEAGKEMGVNTWAAFAGSDDNAIVDGDFVVLADELQGALKSLRKSGINIVAIHHHMITDEPRTIFFHYWGRRPAKISCTRRRSGSQNHKDGCAVPIMRVHRTSSVLFACLVITISGCAFNRQTVLTTAVGPAPSAEQSTSSNGTLAVYSATEYGTS